MFILSHKPTTMKKQLLFTGLLGLGLFISSCGGGESPASCAEKYCALSAKLKSATSEEEKLKARNERNDYENELEKKYKGNESFFKDFEKEVEKCGGGG